MERDVSKETDMLATHDTLKIEAAACAACGRAHRFTLSLTPADEAPGRPLHGFFGTCPVIGNRVWFVIALPAHLDGGTRVVEIEPDTDEDPWAAQRGRPERSEATALGPLSNFPSRGIGTGGFRATGRAPELLRMALGCPHHG